MSFFNSLDISGTGMSAERFRMDTISCNIANVNTVDQLSGDPYKRKVAVVGPADKPKFVLPCGLGGDNEDMPEGGVQVMGVVEDNSENSFKYMYDPGNPKAEKEGKYAGYVKMPNISVITEMTNLMAASRAYEANASALENTKSILMKALDIGK